MNEQLVSILISFLPILVFLIIEMLYDYKYVLKKPFYLGIQYLFFVLIAAVVYLYIRYTLIQESDFLDTEQTEDGKKYTKTVLKNTKNMVLFGMLLFVFILVSCVLYAKFTNNKIKGITIFFIYSVISLATLAYKYEQIKYYRDNEFDPTEKISFIRYFTEGLNTTKTEENGKFQKVDNSVIIPGLVFGLVFGFIDNAGLISGLDALDSPFSVISRFFVGSPPIGGSKLDMQHYKEKLEGTTSGLGNLFSDGLGVTLGAFFGNLAKRLFPSNNEQPLWVDMVGISLGCILGIAIPITLKNLVTGDIIKKGILSFRFIKDLMTIILLFTGFIVLCIKIPEKAKEDIE